MSRRTQHEISVLVPPNLVHLTSADPRRVGPYLLIGRLGADRTGTVYAAVNPAASDDPLVTVRTLELEHLDEEPSRSALSERLNALTTVDSRCYVPPIAFDAAARPPWMATNYVAGIELSQFARRRGAMARGRLIALAAGLAEGLAALHARDVAHGDLKPSNVLLSTKGPRILDCALPGDGSVLRHSAAWMSPERHRGGPPTPAADVFAWAATVAFAATGRLPFGLGEPEEIAARVAEGEPDLDGVPETLLPLIERALADDPGRRPSVRELMGSTIAAWEENSRTQAMESEEGDYPAEVRGTAVTRLLSREWHGIVDPARLPRMIQLHNGRIKRPARVPLVAGGAVLALALVGGGAWAGGNALSGHDPLSGAPPERPSPSPSTSSPDASKAVVRFDPSEQDNPKDGPWVYTPVEREGDEPSAPAAGHLTQRDWSAQWSEKGDGEPRKADIADDAEVLCARFCQAGPGHIKDDRGTYELDAQDFIDYLGWGQEVIAEVEFADEENDDGQRQIVKVTELFPQPLDE